MEASQFHEKEFTWWKEAMHSTGKLWWPDPEVLTSISSYLKRWPDSEKYLLCFIFLFFFLPQNMSTGNNNAIKGNWRSN